MVMAKLKRRRVSGAVCFTDMIVIPTLNAAKRRNLLLRE
jgi:hypothetical protein